ncbi:MAG: tripartite tricarboxylate transporter substrate binding protein [Treponema sp.]|nr:tripartite tricarboxylate transporter substrate binding protein [Treponema sp.]
MKRIFSVIAVLALAFALGSCREDGPPLSPEEAAANWPSRGITVISTHGAGGDTDFNARLISRFLERDLGVSVTVVNVTGGNGNIAMSQFRNGPSDGYTFIMTNTAALSGNEATGMADFGWDAFEPVSIFGRQSGENIVVSADSPFTTLTELIEGSKANPGAMRFGISIGGGVHTAFIIMQETAGAQFTAMDTGDGAARLISLLGNHVEVTILPFATARDHIETGSLRALSTILSERPALIPDIPTAREQGYTDLVIDTMYVALAPRGTNSLIVERMNAAILNVIDNDPEFRAEVNRFNLQEPWGLSIQETMVTLEEQRRHFMRFSEFFR